MYSKFYTWMTRKHILNFMKNFGNPEFNRENFSNNTKFELFKLEDILDKMIDKGADLSQPLWPKGKKGKILFSDRNEEDTSLLKAWLKIYVGHEKDDFPISFLNLKETHPKIIFSPDTLGKCLIDCTNETQVSQLLTLNANPLIYENKTTLAENEVTTPLFISLVKKGEIAFDIYEKSEIFKKAEHLTTQALEFLIKNGGNINEVINEANGTSRTLLQKLCSMDDFITNFEIKVQGQSGTLISKIWNFIHKNKFYFVNYVDKIKVLLENGVDVLQTTQTVPTLSLDLFKYRVDKYKEMNNTMGEEDKAIQDIVDVFESLTLKASLNSKITQPTQLKNKTRL